MKRKLIFLSLFCMAFGAEAREYLSVLDSNVAVIIERSAEYRCKRYMRGSHENLDHFMMTVSDNEELVGDRMCRKITFTDLHKKISDIPPRYVYEEDGRLFDYFPETKASVPIMDMNLVEGDSVPLYILETGEPFIIFPSWLPSTDIIVEKVDEVVIKGVKRKRITFENDKGCWIEGICPSRLDMLYLENGAVIPRGRYLKYIKMLEVFEMKQGWWLSDEYLFYTNEVFTMTGQTPVNAIPADATPDAGQPYDLSGRPVASPRPGQVYIQANKKFIQK